MDRKQRLSREKTSRIEGEKRSGVKGVEKTCGEREAGKMSITLTPKQSGLFRWMSQGLKHYPTFKPSLFTMRQKWRHTQTLSHTHADNIKPF